jgi:dTDP-glucose 4,6-dehydratase
MSYQAKKMLVTGGAGFIGSNYIRHMLGYDDELEIVNLDKLTYAGNKDNLVDLPNEKHHHFVEGDICDEELIAKLLREFDIDTIVHFAAESHVDRSITGPEAFVETNIIGTFTLLEEARKYWLQEKEWGDEQCRFHHISTDEVFGALTKTAPAFTEVTQYQPNSPYSASKAGSDHFVRAYQHTYGLPTTTTNCSNNYGPYQHTEKLLPTIIGACVKQVPIPVYGDGSNIRDWLYVGDHCEAIDLVIRRGRLGETYNVGGDCEVPNIDLVTRIVGLMDKHNPDNAPHDKLVTFVTDRPGHDWRYAINMNKIKSELGWEPKTSVQEGLAKTIDHFTQ